MLANGGELTYQHAVILSSRPRSDGSPYPIASILPKILTDVFVPVVEERAEGEAVIETYTVDFDRDGTSLRGHVIGRLKGNGHRFIANHGDEETMRELCSSEREPIGRVGWVHADAVSGRNLFSFRGKVKL